MGGEDLQFHGSKAGLDMVLDMSSIGRLGVVLNVAPIFLAPDVQPLAQGHLTGFPVVVFVQSGNSLGHLFTDFLLGLAIDGLADVLSSAGVHANDEPGFPSSVGLLADAAFASGTSFFLCHGKKTSPFGFDTMAPTCYTIGAQVL